MSNKGILAAFGAFLIWGFLPLYLKCLEQSSALDILSHRTVWSLLFVALLLLLRSQWHQLLASCRQGDVLLNGLSCAALLAGNWLIYIWAINAGHIVESSLGYFINPLISVLLGVIFLKEGLRPWQWLCIAVAAAGVVYLTVSYGRLPWIALSLASMFGVYGLLRKRGKLGSIEGLTLETGLLSVPALAYLLYLNSRGLGSFAQNGAAYDLLLAGSGIATALPLLLFAYGARQINLSTLGLMQYIAPSIQLVLGVFVFSEPFPVDRMIGFGLIWLALLLYSGEGIYRRYWGGKLR